MIVSYYGTEKQWLFDAEYDASINSEFTPIVYNGKFIEPKFDTINDVWFEDATGEEVTANINAQPTLLAKLCDEKGVGYYNELEINFDTLSFLQSTEAKYALKGLKSYKDFKYINENGINVLVVRINFYPVKQTKIYKGVSTENVLVGMGRTIRFYIDDNQQYYKEKVMAFEAFDLKETEVLDANQNLASVIYTSTLAEKNLRNERLEADSQMKSFNPVLYNWLYNAYGTLYSKYLSTGNSTQLKQAFNIETDPTNLYILGKLVEESSLRILLGEMAQYPQITVKQLINMNLQ